MLPTNLQLQSVTLLLIYTQVSKLQTCYLNLRDDCW